MENLDLNGILAKLSANPQLLSGALEMASSFMEKMNQNEQGNRNFSQQMQFQQERSAPYSDRDELSPPYRGQNNIIAQNVSQQPMAAQPASWQQQGNMGINNPKTQPYTHTEKAEASPYRQQQYGQPQFGQQQFSQQNIAHSSSTQTPNSTYAFKQPKSHYTDNDFIQPYNSNYDSRCDMPGYSGYGKSSEQSICLTHSTSIKDHSALLEALRPYLCDARQEKLDYILKILTFMKLF